MKMMFETVCEVGNRLIQTLDEESQIAVDNVIEIKDVAARFTTDVSIRMNFDENSMNSITFKGHWIVCVWYRM
jgi:hypothetical protein